MRSTAFGSALHKLGRAAVLAGAAVTAGVVVGLEKSVHAAMDAQASQARLEQAFKSAHVSLKPYSKALDETERASRKLGFTDTDVRESLGSLIVATHDYRKASTDLSVAQDLARFKHVQLSDATKMLTMAMTGSQRAAKQLGIVVIPTTKNVDALKRSHVDLTTAVGKAELAQAKLADKMALGQAVIDQVTAKTKGQASVYGKTAAGALARFSAEWDHLKVVIGTPFLGAVSAVADGLSGVIDLIDRVSHAPSLKIALDIGGQGLKDLGVRIKNQVQGAIGGTDWRAVGATLGQAISAGFVFSDAAVSRGLAHVLAFVNSHAQQFATVGATLAVRMVSTLLDPGFWVHHLDLLFVLLSARFGGEAGGLLVKAAGRVGGRAILALIEPFRARAATLAVIVANVADRIPGLIARPFGRAAALAGGAIAHIASSLRSDLRGALSKVPGWLSAAFKIGAVVAVWGAIQTAIDKVRSFISWLKRIPHDISVHFHVSAPSLLGPGGKGQGGSPFRNAGGGVVPMSAGASRFQDSVPALLTPGEMILNRKQQEMLGGPRRLAEMFGFTGYAAGGVASKGKPKHISPHVPGSIREAEARAAGTKTLDDDIAAARREERWVVTELHRHDLTNSERESLRVRKIRIENRVKKLKERKAKADKAAKAKAARNQRDYSQLPGKIQYDISASHLTESTADDLVALREAEAFLVKQLKRKKLTYAQKSQIIDQLVSVRGDIQSITDSVSTDTTSPDLQAQLDQANARASAAQRGSDLANAFVSTGVFAGGGGMGGGAPVIFQSLFPPTPEQARQAAAAAAEGAGYQGYRTNSQDRLGV